MTPQFGVILADANPTPTRAPPLLQSSGRGADVKNQPGVYVSNNQ